MTPSIRTYTGKYFNFVDINEQSIDILDIAHGLSQTCRFGGQSRYFYSVAQHSVLVASLLPRHLQFQGLMHDAHEAYIGDIPSPIKQLLPDFQALEHRIEVPVRAYFGLPADFDPAVRIADLAAFLTEKRDIVGAPEWETMHIDTQIKPWPRRIRPLSARQAEAQFMAKFKELRYRKEFAPA